MKPPTKITREERQVKNQAMVVWQNITSIRSVHSQAVLYTRAPTLSLIFFFFVLFLFFSFLFLLRYRFPPSPSNNTETPANQRNAIVQYILVLTVLGTVAVKTQCLIGDKLLAQGVKASTNGDTAIIASAQVEDGCGRERNLCMVVIVCRSQDRHTQGQDLIQEKRNMVSPT